MDGKLLIGMAAAVAIASLPTATAWAGQQGGGQDAAGERAHDRGVDRAGRLDRAVDQDRARVRDPGTAGSEERLRNRDRLPRDEAAPAQIGAWSLLTDAERQRFHQQMQQARTEEERARIRSVHRQVIESRARDMGGEAPFGAGAGRMRDQAMMSRILTNRERQRFHEQMRTARTAEERQGLRDEHQRLIRERAREMGIELPPGPSPGPAPRS